MIKTGRNYFGDAYNGSYRNILPRIEPDLMLDLGAAIGGYTRLMRENSSKLHVIAFEPFAGNWSYFWKRIGADEMIELRNCAVADKSGTASFFVSSIVTAKCGFWTNFPGSSSK